MSRITPNLWFDTEALDAARYYASIFPSSEILAINRYTDAGPGEEGTVVTVDFTLDGMRFTAINGGPEFRFTEAISLMITCKDQEEVDRYWNTFVGDGGEESMCGWLKDRYGLSWQVVPEGLEEFLADPDPARASRAMKAMLQMRKLDLGLLRAAADSGD